MKQPWKESVSKFADTLKPRRVELLGMHAKEREKTAKTQLKNILQLDKVDYVYVDTHVNVVTKPLVLNLVTLGVYKIVLTAKNLSIAAIRNERKVTLYGDRYDHPYVSYGSVCFGNCFTTINQFARAKDYAGVVALTIDFLESVDLSYDDDAQEVLDLFEREMSIRNDN